MKSRGGGKGGVVVSRVLWEDKVAVQRQSPAEQRGWEGGRLRAIFTVQRGHPPSAPAFSCWKDLSEGWGLPGEGTADWEPSPPLWLALLKICQTLQCKKREGREVRSGAVCSAPGTGVSGVWNCNAGRPVGLCSQAHILGQLSFLGRQYGCPLGHPSPGSRGNQTHASVTETGKHHSKGLSSSGTRSRWHQHSVRPRKAAGKHLQPGGLLAP